MSCDNVQERISPLVDGRLPDAERENVLAHIGACRDCGEYLESMESVRYAVARLDRPAVPPELTSKLRVLASHERSRQLARITWKAWVKTQVDRVSLTFDNLMRPLAFPFAGGLVSSLIIFGLFIPTLTFQHAFADQVLFAVPDGEVVSLAPTGGYIPTESENPPWIQR